MHKDPAERPFIWDIVDELGQTENANSNENTVDQVRLYAYWNRKISRSFATRANFFFFESKVGALPFIKIEDKNYNLGYK